MTPRPSSPLSGPLRRMVLAVLGNCDYPEIRQELIEEGVSLDRSHARVGDIDFVGIGGSTPCPGKTPSSQA